jgi:hypothetical protein
MTETKKASFFSYGITFAVFIALLAWGVFGSIAGNELAYVFISFLFIIQITTFAMAFRLGSRNVPFKWVYPLVLLVIGVAIYLIGQLTKLYYVPVSLDGLLLFSCVPALAGVGIGKMARMIRTEKQQ